MQDFIRQSKVDPFTEEEKKEIEQSITQLRKILQRHDLDISSITGLVTPGQVADTKRAVEVRFAEESVLSVVMNMVAFD